jgi:hypothetical protein
MVKLSSSTEDLPYVTCRIETIDADGSSSVGTGFYFRFDIQDRGEIVALVTNRHVVEEARSIRLPICLAGEDGQATFETLKGFDLDEAQEWIVYHPDAEVDLAYINITLPLSDMMKSGKMPFLKTLQVRDIPNDEFIASMGSVEEVFMVGYPNGLWDEVNNRPITRRGITASEYRLDYNGLPEFLIDCPVVSGSSGSPVILASEIVKAKDGQLHFSNRFALLGILWGGPRYEEGVIVPDYAPSELDEESFVELRYNIGYCIKASKLLDFIPLAVGR